MTALHLISLFVLLSFSLAETTLAAEVPSNASPRKFGDGWDCNRGYAKDASSTKCEPVQVPENGQLNVFGNAWECKRGFAKSGSGTECVEVLLPQNAVLDYTGHNWVCARGFKKDSSGKACAQVYVPQNAELDFTGQRWTCKRGFKPGESSTACEAVAIPEYGQLDYSGRDWVCKSGYKREGAFKCALILIPENAKLNIFGTDWECKEGFSKKDASCLEMTPEEKAQQQVLIATAKRAFEERHKAVAARQLCETEYKTGAKVCIAISGGDFDCQKDYSGDHFKGCEAEISYDLNTDYGGGAYLDVDVSCEVEIEYKGRNAYVSKTDSDNYSDSHSLYAHDSEASSLTFDFPFSTFDEVVQAKVADVRCEIESVNLW